MHKVLMIEDEGDRVQFFGQALRNFKQIRFFSAERAREGVEIAKRGVKGGDSRCFVSSFVGSGYYSGTGRIVRSFVINELGG